MKNQLLLLFSLLFLSSCTSKKVIATKTEAPIIEISSTELVSRGKSLYENKCAKCHDLPVIKRYSFEEWKPIMDRMQKQANISDVEKETINFYISRNL